MKTKTAILSIAIITALPFTANATQTIVQTQTPAAVGANGTVTKAAATGPYQTATIGEHDDEHIATTAYVKGAYNDAIAGINSVATFADGKQDQLRTTQGQSVEGDQVLSSYNFDPAGMHGWSDVMRANVISDQDNKLMTSGTVIRGMLYLDDKIEDRRVTIYTTWGDDTTTATTQVALDTASAQ